MQTEASPRELERVPSNGRKPRPVRRVRWGRWIFAGVVVLLAASILTSRLLPRTVDAVHPRSATVAEIIASSGVVQGHAEAVVGAQVPGIVTSLLVDEGSQVRTGQLLAKVQSNTADAQIQQAKAALATAKATLAQTSIGAQPSEIRAAKARADQAAAAVGQQEAMLKRAELGRSQAVNAVGQAKSNYTRAQAAERQARARLDLSQTTRERKSFLAQQGAIPKSDLDAAETSLSLAKEDVAAAEQAVEAARLGYENAQEAVGAASFEVDAAAKTVRAAKAQHDATLADLKTLESQPRREAVAVATQRVQEAQAALALAETQAKNTDVRAPFAGTVTQIVARPGTSSAAGVLHIVGTERLEVKLDMDESSLKDIHLGERALINSPVHADQTIQAHVSRLGPQIDSLRGTLEVFVTSDQPQPWMRPGQTLNVNVVTIEKVTRLFLPSDAILRTGDQTTVLVVADGRAVSKQVRVGPPYQDQVPVLDGLGPDDAVIRHALGVSAGDRVRAR